MVPLGASAQIKKASTGMASTHGFYSIEGEVQKPGRYPLTQGARVKRAIEAAGGLTRNADPKRSEIIRSYKVQKTYYTIYFHADNALTGDPADNFVLLDGDRMIIPAAPSQAGVKTEERPSPVKTVPDTEAKKLKEGNFFIDGEVVKPGAYPWKEHMTVRDMIIYSGGTLKTSFPESAELVSTLPGMDRKTVNLKKAMDDDPGHNLPVGLNDRLVVRNMPKDKGPVFGHATLSGEVLFPGQYPITKGERLLSVIERAGGYTAPAYPRGAVFTKERLRKIQQSIFDEVAACIEREHLAKNKHKDATQRLLEQIKTFKCAGRIQVSVTGLDVQRDKGFDIELEDGDTFHVPPLSDAVRIAGAVRKPGLYEHDGQSAYRDYVKAAGGYGSIADEASVFVVKADGGTRYVGKAFMAWSKKGKRVEIGGSKHSNYIIEPGDVIVVPELIAHPAWLRQMRDAILILMNNGIIPTHEVQKNRF